MKAREIMLKSILAGMLISIGGWVYLAIGGVAGAILFAFGLLAVVHFNATLYTGTAGFAFDNGKKWWKLPLILLFNANGCILMGLLSRFSSLDLIDAAERIVMARVEGGFTSSLALGIGCGLVMTTAVAFTKDGKYLPLLFGVPVFILCGFQHSIADAFYISACSTEFLNEHLPWVLASWSGVAIGNFIGCSIPRVVGYELHKSI